LRRDDSPPTAGNRVEPIGRIGEAPSMTDIVPVDLLDPEGEELARAWLDVYVAVQDDLLEGRGSPWTLAELQELHRAPEKRRSAFAAVADRTVVGSVEVIETLRDNPDSAMIWLAVHPDHRGRGVGTALLQHAERVATDDGRTVLRSETEWLADSTDEGEGFAIRHGYAVAQTSLRSDLALPADVAELTRLRDGSEPSDAGRSTAYAMESVTGMPPGGWLDALAELNRRMSTDMPLGDLALEEEDWDAERVRRAMQRLLDAGRALLTSVARHRESGRLVGFTEVGVSAGTPDLAYQGSTLVLKEHRGHGLGLRLKAANSLAVMDTLPAVTRVRTWNADDNVHMLAVNRRLGYLLDAYHRLWQKRL